MTATFGRVAEAEHGEREREQEGWRYRADELGDRLARLAHPGGQPDQRADDDAGRHREQVAGGEPPEAREQVAADLLEEPVVLQAVEDLDSGG